MSLDTIVARLQNMHPFNIYQVTAAGDAEPWWEVTGAEVVPQVVLNENDITEQVQAISAQIMHWGRLCSQCKRVWEIEERKYRIWRDSYSLELLRAGEEDKTKKMTEKVRDMTVRQHPEYTAHYIKTERAEEAYNAASAILDGFRAKKDAIKAAVYRSNESGAAILKV